MTSNQIKLFKERIYDVCNEFGLSEFNITSSKFVNDTEMVYNLSTCKKEDKTIVSLISELTCSALKKNHLNENK